LLKWYGYSSDKIADKKFKMKYTLPQKIPNFPLAKQINIIYFQKYFI